jgi:hypothetical protein
VGKLLLDLASMREESILTAGMDKSWSGAGDSELLGGEAAMDALDEAFRAVGLGGQGQGQGQGQAGSSRDGGDGGEDVDEESGGWCTDGLTGYACLPACLPATCRALGHLGAGRAAARSAGPLPS